MPRPGSHEYDIKRARRRKHLEDQGFAVDDEAGREANRQLQEDEGMRPVRRTERGAGPAAERRHRSTDRES